jgi:hypothetical protein
MYYAFRADAFCYAAGANGKQVLQQALASQPQRAPLALISGNLKQLNELAPLQENDPALARMVFTDEQPGHFRLELNGGDALRLHASLELAVLRFVYNRMERLPIQIRVK